MSDAIAEGEARDPATSPARLAELAAAHPDLQSLIAVHPRVYPALQEWIATHGEPAAQAVASRARNGASPAVAAAPAAPETVPASTAPASAAPPAGAAATPKERIAAWAVAGGLAVVALVVAVPLVLAALAAGTPAGTLADGSPWGQTLGKEVQRAAAVTLDGTGTQRSLAVDRSTGTAYIAGYEGLWIVDAGDISRATLVPIALETGGPALALSPDGARAYLTDGSGGEDAGELVALSLNGTGATEDFRMPLPGPGNMGEMTALSPDGSMLYIADMNTGVWVLSTADGAVLANPASSMASTIAVNPVDGTVVVDDPLGDAILLVDPLGTRILQHLSSEAGLPDAVAISPDGRTIAVGEGGAVRLYAADGSPQSSVELAADIADIAFSPDSAELAVLTTWSEASWESGEREGIRLLDVASATELTRIPLPGTYILGSVAFTGNPGELLALSGDGLARIDLGASRTDWAGYTVLFAVLGLIVLAAVLAAATISRWRPALAASRERSRQAQAQRNAEAAQRAAEAQTRQQAAAAAAAQDRAAAEHAERVRQVQQWREAYREANGGQEPPAGFVPMAVPAAPAAPARTGTNVMAILAIIFGFGGGLLGIVFGHIALSQIARTGESGKGLAITGLVFGYLGLVAIVGWLVFAFVLVGAAGGF